ncbi:SpaA isopeptide-forming pilin-related protein [Butyrivibrio sp. FC2001]|uniref:SpaA isopeptide-forming pilin-related protein n=1 Tax=Butyrivibrio sp. FC2001 TaxID=1280671 RepID=UPI0012DFC18E|nr:SpaA isopeptide-forming pilin-related protein [Butyrivibrio sp. FC2001]
MGRFYRAMPRHVGKEKLNEYLKKHEFLKRWLSIMLVLSLLVGTGTLYAMNRGASAVSEEGAEEVGMVLEDYSDEGSDGGDDGVVFADSEDEEEESYDDSSEESEESYEDESGSEETEEAVEPEESSEDTENTEESTEENSEETENTENPENEENAENPDNQENTEEVATEETAENPETEEPTEEKEDEITKDIILKISYVDDEGNVLTDNDGNAYADEEEIVLDESVELPEDAAELEGFEFKKATYDDLEIKKVDVKKYTASDETEYTYYEFVSDDMPSYEDYEQDEEGKYISRIKEDTSLVFVYEKTKTEEEESEEEKKAENTEEGKIAEQDIPESVDLADYVTETVIERLKEDGTWEAITEADIKEGDHLRITVKYSMPQEAALSDDIHMSVPEQYGNVITSQSDLDDGNGTVEATEDNQIKVNYSDEYKKEKIASESENDAKDGSSEDAGNTDGSSESNEEDKTSESTDDNAKLKKSGSLTSALLSFVSPVMDFFDGFTIVAHAAGQDYGNATGTLTYETIVDSTNDGGMKITGVSVKKNPDIHWNSDGTKSYTGGTEIQSGAQVNQGEGLIFRLEYILKIGTVSKEKPSVTYALSNHGITVDQAASGSVYNGNNEEVGTFTIDESGLITITFHDEFADKNKTNVIDDSYFFFYATAKGDEGKEKTTRIYEFGNDVTFTIEILNVKSPDLTLNKKILEDYSRASGKIKYQITLSTENGSGTEILFKDWLEVYNNWSNNNNFLQDLTNTANAGATGDFNFIKKYSDGRTEDARQYMSLNSENYVVLQKLEAGESYVATYTLNVPDVIAKSTTPLRLKNYAEATFNGSNKREAAVYSDFYGDVPTIKKSGKADKNKGEVTWNITINEGHVNLKGYNLSDLIYKFEDSGWTQVTTPYIGELAVKSVEKGSAENYGPLAKGSTITLGENGYTFTQDDYCKYEFTYTYKYSENEIIYGNLKNQARISIQGSQSGNTAEAYVWIGTIDPASKTAEGVSINADGSAKVSWKVTLNAPIRRNEGTNNQEYWRFYEMLTDSDEVFTSSDIENLKSAIRSVYSGRFEVSALDSKKAGTISGTRTLEIKFYDDITETVSFTFSTTGDIGDGKGSVLFKNRAAVYNKDVYARTAQQSFEPFVRKYDGKNIEKESEAEYYTEDCYKQGILTWIIEANIPANNELGTLYVIDTLPSGVSLIENGTYSGKFLYGVEVSENNSFSGASGFDGGQASLNGVSFSQSGDSGNIVISFDGKAAGGKKLYFRVHAKIANDYDFASVGTASFTNNVVVSKDDSGSEKLGEASQTQKVTKTEYAMTKKSQLASGSINTIEYVLDVNPGAADLLQGGDTLTLTDVLESKCLKDYTIYLVPDSAVAYEVTTDENGVETETPLSQSEYSYSLSSYESEASYYGGKEKGKFVYSTIVFKIPDGKHLKIKYRYTFTGETNSNVELSNDAKLEGISLEHDSASNSTTVTIQDAGARANVRGINLYKVDADNSGIMLQGAIFSLSYYDGTQWVEQKNEKSADGTYTTDSNGLVAIAPLVYNVGYKLVEKTAPQGYAKDETPICFYIPSADTENYKLKLPDNFFTELGGSEFTAGQPVYAPNKKNSTSFTVKKDWVNADDVTKPSAISIRIGRRLGNVVNGKSDSSGLGNYYTVNIDRRNPNNQILEYVGFPSVKDGSQLTFTFATHGNDLTKIIINGEEHTYADEVNSNSITRLTKTITISGNTTIQILNGWQTCDKPMANVSASVASSDAGLDTSNSTKGATGATVGAEDIGFKKETTITAVDDWKVTLNGLDRFYKDDTTGITYEWLYYVSEVANLYYTASYSDNNSPGITSGTITITNTRNDVPAYALPSTGGSGRIPFTIGGLVLVTLALVGEEYFRRKRRKRK